MAKKKGEKYCSQVSIFTKTHCVECGGKGRG